MTVWTKHTKYKHLQRERTTFNFELNRGFRGGRINHILFMRIHFIVKLSASANRTHIPEFNSKTGLRKHVTMD